MKVNTQALREAHEQANYRKLQAALKELRDVQGVPMKTKLNSKKEVLMELANNLLLANVECDNADDDEPTADDRDELLKQHAMNRGYSANEADELVKLVNRLMANGQVNKAIAHVIRLSN